MHEIEPIRPIVVADMLIEAKYAPPVQELAETDLLASRYGVTKSVIFQYFRFLLKCAFMHI